MIEAKDLKEGQIYSGSRNIPLSASNKKEHRNFKILVSDRQKYGDFWKPIIAICTETGNVFHFNQYGCEGYEINKPIFKRDWGFELFKHEKEEIFYCTKVLIDGELLDAESAIYNERTPKFKITIKKDMCNKFHPKIEQI